jgi:hypothetical protein
MFRSALRRNIVGAKGFSCLLLCSVIFLFFYLSLIEMRIVAPVAAASAPLVSSDFLEDYYDVIVVGAGTGGTSAAIQAARLGAKVALLEETDWIGGQMTAAGVTSMDEGHPFGPPGQLQYDVRDRGIYKEFVDKIVNYYATRFDPPKPVGTCYFNSDTIAFEPHIGQQILYEMVQETRNRTLTDGTHPILHISLRSQVTGVLQSGNTVQGVSVQITTPSGVINKTIYSHIVVDATEYGDVLPLTTARYRAGNSTSDNLNLDAAISDITYLAVVKKYSEGLPSHLWVQNPPEEYDVVSQGFRKMFKADGNPLSWPIEYPVHWAVHNGYRGMPDSTNLNNYFGWDLENITKTGVNWANDYKMVYRVNDDGWFISPPIDLTVRYLEDRAYRRQQNGKAKRVTLSFIHYTQYEIGEPLWSISTDEGYDTPYNLEQNDVSEIPPEYQEIEKYFPVMPYVRESRRMIGLHTLTAGEIKRVGSPLYPYGPPTPLIFFSSAVALGDYPVDLHRRKGITGDLEDGLETEDDNLKGVSGAFQIPFESLIPESVNGLLAAEKNISAARLASGAIRLQPITMLTGQTVGVMAALAAEQGIQPRHLNIPAVQNVLLDAKSPLSLYKFTDVGMDHPFWKYVQFASLYKVMIGYGNGVFGVNDSLLRKQAAAALVRRFNISTDNLPPSQTFADVPTTDPFYPFIEAIYREGITAGCSSNPPQFCPNNPLNRAAFAVFLIKAMKLDLNEASPDPIFIDVPASHWAFRYIQLMAQHELTSGCGSTPQGKMYCPDNITTRGQAAVFLMKSLVLE